MVGKVQFPEVLGGANIDRHTWRLYPQAVELAKLHKGLLEHPSGGS